MFNDFLSSLLQIVIVIDVIGVVAYFILTALRPREADAPRAEEPVHMPGHSRALGGPRITLLARVRARLGRMVPQRVGRGPSSSSEGLEASFERLRRVLNSYQEGLT